MNGEPRTDTRIVVEPSAGPWKFGWTASNAVGIWRETGDFHVRPVAQEAGIRELVSIASQMNDQRVGPPTKAEAKEFRRLHALAFQRRWKIPDRHRDVHGPRVWMRYWAACEEAEGSGGRPVVPHRSGGGIVVPPHMPGGGAQPPEDHFDRAVRINENRERWEGWPR